MDQTIAPKINPKMVPRIPTVNPIFASFSFLVFAITAKIIAVGPKRIGKNINEMEPKIMARIDNVLLLDWLDEVLDVKSVDITSPVIWSNKVPSELRKIWNCLNK